MNSGNTQNDVKASHWIKAAICAVIVLLLLFFIFTRSSCTQAGGREGQASVEESENGSASQSDSNEDGKSQDVTTSSEAEGDSESTEEAEVAEAAEVAESSENPQDSQNEDSPPTTENSPSEPDANSSPPVVTPASAGAPRGQNIGGLLVKGDRLGVILDVSGSMKHYLESLRSEIRSRFDSPVFLEVEGCFIEPSTADPPGSAFDSRNPRLRDSVMNAIRELVIIEKVDSIYWFCDLQDEQTNEGLKELARLAQVTPGGAPAFHLYVRSTDEKPGKKLDQIIRLTKGAFEKRR
ncbi:hypothetical protein N9L71_06635 [Verrucomicrobiales bacterium]|nr:hypothetical protein [Verrucomicrobiales bacterium]